MSCGMIRFICYGQGLEFTFAEQQDANQVEGSGTARNEVNCPRAV